MYAEFLKVLAELAEKLTEAIKLGGQEDENGLPTPYLSGSVDVFLDGSKVGRFDIEDEWVNYTPEEKK